MIISKPDKGHAVVLMNRDDYNNKMIDILNDVTKFKKIENIDPLLYTLRQEGRVNYTLNKLSKNKCISDDT